MLVDLFPTKTDESIAFDAELNSFVTKLKENLSDFEFKKFETLLANKIHEALPEVEMYSIPPNEEEPGRFVEHFFRMLLNEHEHAPVSYTQELFASLVKLQIKDSLKEAIVEFYSLTHTLPPAAQVFEIGLGSIIESFREFKLEYLNLQRGRYYYLKECIYTKSTKGLPPNRDKIGSFMLRLCLWESMLYGNWLQKMDK